MNVMLALLLSQPALAEDPPPPAADAPTTEAPATEPAATEPAATEGAKVDCSRLADEEQAKCEAGLAQGTGQDAQAKKEKGAKAQRSNDGRMESETSDE